MGCTILIHIPKRVPAAGSRDPQAVNRWAHVSGLTARPDCAEGAAGLRLPASEVPTARQIQGFGVGPGSQAAQQRLYGLHGYASRREEAWRSVGSGAAAVVTAGTACSV